MITIKCVRRDGTELFKTLEAFESFDLGAAINHVLKHTANNIEELHAEVIHQSEVQVWSREEEKSKEKKC